MIKSKNNGANEQRILSRLERLAVFAPKFRDPTTVFGKRQVDRGAGTHDDPMILGSYQLSELGTQFFEMVYDAGWIVRDFDWSEWAWSGEGQRQCSDRDTLGQADCEQLAKLLTSVVRQDRFCDGILENAFENGLLRAIAERAEVLVADEVKPC